MTMGRTTPALMLAAVLAGAALTGARAETPAGPNGQNKPSATEVEQKVGQAYDAMKGYGYAKKQEFLQWADARTAELDRRIAVLRKEVSRADAQAKRRLEKQMAELEEKRKALAAKTDELRRSSAQAWSDMKWSFAAAVDNLEQAYEKASARFKEDQQARKGQK